MEAVADHSSPSIHSLPTELLTKVASHLTPTLHRGWLPNTRGRHYPEWKKQHVNITSLQLTNRLFAAVCRPFVWKTLCFSAEDVMVDGPATLMEVEDVREMVKELRWELSEDSYTNMSPTFLPFLRNLTTLALFTDADLDEDSLEVPTSLTNALRRMGWLGALQLEGFVGFEDVNFNPGTEAPHLTRLNIGSWWRRDVGHLDRLSGAIKDMQSLIDYSGGGELEGTGSLTTFVPSLQSLVIPYYIENDMTWIGYILRELASELTSAHSISDRASFPIKTLQISGVAVLESAATLALLQVFSETAGFRSLRLLNCGITEDWTDEGSWESWASLCIPSVASLVLSMAQPPTVALPLHAFLGAFPNLQTLDVTDVLAPQVLLSSPLDTLVGTPAEVLMFLKYAQEETTIQHLTIRFPSSRNEILRCRRVGEGEEEEKGSYGWARELWREW